MAKVYRFTVGGTNAAGDQDWNSTMHYQTDLAALADEPSAADVLAEIVEHYGTGGNGTGMERWLVTVPSSVKLTFARVYEETDPGGTELGTSAEQTFNYTGAATVIDAALPFALCPWIKFTTDVSSRYSRGGTHIAPTMDQNHFTSAGLFDTGLSYWSAIISLGDYMKDVLNDVIGTAETAVDLRPVIYSRTRRRLDLSPYTFAITQATPSAKPRFLRRRDS